MELINLVNSKHLEGVDKVNIGDANGILFKLDGVSYLALEDEINGYRSCMKELQEVNFYPNNSFEPVPIFCNHKTKGEYNGKANILEIYNKSGGIILRIGTDNIDNYYPCYLENYYPENISTKE